MDDAFRKVAVACVSVVVTFGLVQVGALPARAAELSPDDPAYQDVASVVTGGYTASGADGLTTMSTKRRCRKHQTSYYVEGRNAIGVLLWRAGASLHTCTRKGRVVRKHWGECWGTTGGFPVLWNFKGCSIEAQGNQSLPRRYIWRQWRFKFGYCVTWICKSVTPWVYIGGRGDGSFGTAGGKG